MWLTRRNFPAMPEKGECVRVRVKSSTSLMVIVLLCLLVGLVELVGLQLLAPLENRLLDTFVRQSALRDVPDPEIVILDIDEASIAALADEVGNWPWPRSIYAELLESLFPLNPKAVVFDLMLAEPDLYRPDSDAWLNEVLTQSDAVYFPTLRMSPEHDAEGFPLSEFGSFLGIQPGSGADMEARVSIMLPLAIAEGHWRLGAINYLEDMDGIGRRYYLNLDLYGWQLPSLPVRLAMDMHWPVPPGRSFRLDWRGDTFSYHRYSFAEVLADFRAGKQPDWQARLQNRFIILGTTASGLHDIRHTPISGLHPGVEILATAIDNLKNGLQLREVNRVVPLLLLVVLVGAIGLAFARRLSLPLIGLALVATGLLLLYAARSAVDLGLLLPMLTPLVFAGACFFAGAMHAYFGEYRQRRQTVEVFSRFLDPTVVQDLVASGENRESLSGKECELTVLFSDIRGFTSLSESRRPDEIVDLLNHYFALQVETIFKYGGTLDKFIGDAIMAFWGAPRPDERQAQNAVAAALEMVENLERFRAEAGDAADGFDIGIGLHSGPAVVGFLGSERRRDYTAIGDTVNLASRIEGLTKEVGRILVSEAVKVKAGDDFVFHEKGSFGVKGRKAEVAVFEPGRKHD